jgi:predicted GNAT family acetyltransferase
MTIAPSDLQLEFTRDPAEFLAAAGDHLALDPAMNTVVATIAQRHVALAAEGESLPVQDWWLVVRDAAGEVVGTGMRTARSGSRPLFLQPMPDEAAVAVARTLHARGEEVLGVNGALPAVEVCAAELARLQGGRVEVAQHTRLFELGTLRDPAPVPGRLVAADEDDLDLAVAWFEAFHDDADEQAGRPRGARAHLAVPPEHVQRRIRIGRLWFWVDEAGERVHMTSAHPPSYGVARIGPVYTPPAQRGRGWASAAVAEVSRKILAEGARATLFTDQANPTSNRIYSALGYEPVVDMANLVIVG